MKIIEKYLECYPNPLNLKIGDKIQLFAKDVPEKWKGWNWCKDSTGNEGWISETYFKRNGVYANIIKDYTAQELSVEKNDNIDIIFEDCGWVFCRKGSGEEGWLPAEIIDFNS